MSPTLDNIRSNRRGQAPPSQPIVDEDTTPFQKLLDGIRAAFGRSDNKVDVDEVWKVLESYNSMPNDYSSSSEWSKFTFYDMCKYKRNLVDGYEKYNVMILGWGPNTKSCIHDHAGAHCFMKILDGELIESRFAWPDANQVEEDGEMSILSESRLQLNDVLYINDKVGLHCVENPSMTKTAASLHVYIPPYKECKTFDRRTGRAEDCKLTFYSKRGKVIKEDEDWI